MNMRRALRSSIVGISLLSAATGYSRGGETGTLDETPDNVSPAPATVEVNRTPTKSWSPYYIPQDHFRRLRARLHWQPLAPIPGWNSHRAWKFQDRYFTEDGVYEILPLFRESMQ
jgi:hypothetical protein